VLVVLVRRDTALHVSLRLLFIHRDALERVKLVLDLVPLLRHQIGRLLPLFNLSGHVVNVAFQGQDLLHIVLLFLLKLLDCKTGAADVFLDQLNLVV